MSAKNDTEINDAYVNDVYEWFQEITADERQRMTYEARKRWRMDQLAIKNHSRLKGKAEGRQEGIKKGKQEVRVEIAKKMLYSGFSIEQVRTGDRSRFSFSYLVAFS